MEAGRAEGQAIQRFILLTLPIANTSSSTAMAPPRATAAPPVGKPHCSFHSRNPRTLALLLPPRPRRRFPLRVAVAVVPTTTAAEVPPNSTSVPLATALMALPPTAKKAARTVSFLLLLSVGMRVGGALGALGQRPPTTPSAVPSAAAAVALSQVATAAMPTTMMPQQTIRIGYAVVSLAAGPITTTIFTSSNPRTRTSNSLTPLLLASPATAAAGAVAAAVVTS